ncbi:MAG: hypothetical protein JNL63_06990 [Bacteroidia bacterium]|nr:hypothetical protein [Bacteroidia bacterium]
MKKILFLIIAATTIYSCKKDQDTSALDIGYGYFPNQSGKYIIYDVDSIVKNSFTKQVDTFKFQVKEVIESVFNDNTGRPTLRLERYRKYYSKTVAYDSMSWVLTDVWSANLTSTSAEKVEENVRYVRLIFPVEKYKTWNGNAYNTIGEWNYKYTEIDKAKTVGGIAFDSTLTVVQFEDENLIDKKYYREMYAKNVGLIYRQIIDVHSDSIQTAVPIMNRVTSGIIKYTATINKFGG